MVYESDFYTTRRPYSSRPLVSTYSVTTPSRHYSVRDEPSGRRAAEQQYSYSYSSKTESSRDSNNPYSRPEHSSYTSTTERRSEAGPGGYNYTTDRSSTTGSRPGDYSYSSTASGRLPGGNTYRHYSYRV